jgi:UDP-4-amino-4,6-dideoxy-N-acetyl-beta-L-altrosamine transaminase
MIPYGKQDISKTDIDAVLEVLRSDWLTQGPQVPKFERTVANYVGVKHAVATNSATSALHIACLALGVGVGDWVWTSPNTFVASANCALYCGAKVDFVDIDLCTYNMCVDALNEKLVRAKAKNCLPKVVIPVHFAGQPCDMQAIQKLSKQYGFKILEDASHAIGASYIIPNEVTKSSNRVMVGSCVHSDITVFSFHPVKIITTGEGGLALTNDIELEEKMLRLRTHGTTSQRQFMHSRPPGEIWNYQQIDVGFNYRMTDIQAALGLSQLQRLNEFLLKRSKLASIYDHAFSNLQITTPWQHHHNHSSYHLYPILIHQEICGKNQREVYQAMHDAGIFVNLHYIPVYRHPFYEAKGFKEGYCPNAERYYRATVSLPMYSALTGDQQQKVIASLENILGV